MATVLLKAQADVSRRDSSGKTALIHAAASGQGDLIEQLLDHGANLEASDESGKDALLWASQTNNDRARSILIQRSNPDINGDVMQCENVCSVM